MLSYRANEHEEYNKQPVYNTLSHVYTGFLEAHWGWQHKKRFLEQYEMLFVTKGTLFLSLDDRPLTLDKNELIICSPYRTIRGVKESEQTVSFYWVDFQTNNTDGAWVDDRKYAISSPIQFEQWMTELRSLKWQHAAGREVGDAILLIILNTLRQSQHMVDEQRALIEKIKSYVEDALYTPLSVDQVASELKYDRDYLSRVMKSRTGFTLKEYISERRMEVAKSLLRSSSYSITQIAQIMGYGDANLFSKFFSYHQQISPLRYRKMHMQ